MLQKGIVSVLHMILYYIKRLYQTPSIFLNYIHIAYNAATSSTELLFMKNKLHPQKIQTYKPGLLQRALK